jgi:hypothetical protein
MAVALNADGTTVKATTSPNKVSVKPYWISDAKPQLIVFDVSDPSAPSAGKAIDFASEGSRLNGASEAANGLVVTGVSHSYNPATKIWLQNSGAYQSAQVIDVPVSGDPVMRSLIDVPGKLVAVSELDDKGFLAFTNGNDAGELQVSASDGYDAFLVSTLSIPQYAPCAVDGRRVYVASGNNLLRNSLSDDGLFVAEESLDVGWNPYSLKTVNGIIVGSGGTSILATKSGSNEIKTWQFPTWNVYADRAEVAADGDLLVPLGQYGMERLDR